MARRTGVPVPNRKAEGNKYGQACNITQHDIIQQLEACEQTVRIRLEMHSCYADIGCLACPMQQACTQWWDTHKRDNGNRAAKQHRAFKMKALYLLTKQNRRRDVQNTPTESL